MRRKPHWRESPPNGRKSPVNGKTITKVPVSFVMVVTDAPMLLARSAVGVVQICESKCAGSRIKIEFEHTAVADAVLHLERFHAHAAHDLSRCGAMAHAQHALMSRALHELGDGRHDALAKLVFALAVILLVKIAVRQARIQILARTLKLAKVPLLKALDALVRLIRKRKLKRVARALGRGTVRMVERKATLSQGRADSFSLLDSQLGERRVTLALLATKQVKERLAVTHKVQFWHETSVIAIVCQRLLHLEVGLSQSLFGQNHHKGACPHCGGSDVFPDKTCQNKPVPFWQVLGQMILDQIADGSGVVDVDGSGRKAGIECLACQGFVAGKG